MINPQKRAISLIRYIQNVLSSDALLIGTPGHSNLGDQAISIAEIQSFERLGIHYHEVPSSTYGAGKRIATKLIPKNYPIFFQGGGNLGSLWHKEEYMFRELLRFSKRQRVIVFPQTIYFDLNNSNDIAFFNKSKKIYSSHPNLTIFVRERISYEFMKKHMPEVDVRIVPDLVMSLDISVEKQNRDGVLLCMRNDKERILDDNIICRLEKICEEKGLNIIKTDMYAEKGFSIQNREREVTKKLQQFADSKIVITDRLHGMIFSAIMETPCILLNSKSHKIRGCYDWLKELSYIRFLEDIDDLDRTIEELTTVTPHYRRDRIVEATEPLYNEMKESILCKK